MHNESEDMYGDYSRETPPYLMTPFVGTTNMDETNKKISVSLNKTVHNGGE